MANFRENLTWAMLDGRQTKKRGTLTATPFSYLNNRARIAANKGTFFAHFSLTTLITTLNGAIQRDSKSYALFPGVMLIARVRLGICFVTYFGTEMDPFVTCGYEMIRVIFS